MHASALVSLSLSALLTASLVAQGDTVAPVATPLADALSELTDHSSWAQDARYEGERPDKSTRGAYPIGNGRVFGYVGLGARANTMQGVSGPSYQTEEEFAPHGHFGQHTLDLFAGGRAVELPEQHVRRVRGANFVVTVDEDAKGLSLRTLSFAPPGGTALVRVVEVANLGGQPVDGVVLRLSGDRLRRPDDRSFPRAEYASGARRCDADFLLAGPEAGAGEGAAFAVAVGSLAPQATWRTVLRIETARRDGQAPAPVAVPLDAAQAVEAARAQAATTLQWWRDKLSGTTYFDTDHVKLRDLFHDWKVLMLTQRDAGSGAVSPMINYRGCWVRDSVGPLLAFLRFNMWAEAKAILVYLYNATRLLGAVPNRVPLDLDFTPLAGRKVDWDAIEVPPSEVPSWIILMHFWYWRVTRDHELITAHKQFLERCLRGQKRVADALLTFHGDETWLHGAFYSLWPERVSDARLLADDQWQGRRAFSLASGVQYLLSIQALGEMENGIDEAAHPEKYGEGSNPNQRPGQRYLTASFKIMQALEEAFWMDDLGMFAPAVSPVNRQRHREPYADVNLMPLWLGWTFPSGEKSRDNLKNSLARLWLRDGRIGQTPDVGHACGHTQGKLVVALTERDAKDRMTTVDALLRMAEPAGEWGELYDPQGRPIAAYHPEWPNRCRPWESGVNLDALMFAISGVRFVATPNFDARDIRAKLRLPTGATYVSMRNVRKDGRDVDIYWRETWEKMTEQERAENEEKVPEKRRDPTATHRRVRFRVSLNSANPKQGYYDVGLNAAGTLFVRWLTREQPIDEVEYWTDDHHEFLPPPSGEGPPAAPASRRHRIEVPESAEVLYLACRDLAGELAGGDNTVCLVDTGLPMQPADLAEALLDKEGKPRVTTLFYDWRADAASRTTFKTAAFWSDSTWVEAQTRFEQAGGRILRARFVDRLQIEGGAKATADADGRIVIRGSGAGETVATATLSATTAQEVVLRAGSSSDLRVEVNGETVLEHRGRRHPLPDLDSGLVTLKPGANEIRVVLPGEGESVVWLRVTDARGLPVEGVQ